jgi:AcrR family transcriptional regulator
MNTKEKIMLEALNLFSVRGFEAVSVRDIARAVGIKESSLYNHFTNKQDIFDTILNEYSKRIEEFFYQIRITGEDKQFKADERTINMYRNMTSEQFAALAGQVFEYVFTDEINVKLRKMLTIEQYRSEKIAKIFRNISFDDSINFQAMLLDEMIKAGFLIKTDPYILALEFFSPAFLLFYKYDNDEKSLKEAKELFMRHIRHFSEVYTVKDTRKENK